MELNDILPMEAWARFEEELFERFQMNAAVYTASGIGLTGKPHWCNRLCPEIKANKDSLAAICASGNQYFMAQARQIGKPVIGECDAGFTKIAVPIFLNEHFLGTAGGCGLLPEGGEVETFLIAKTMGLAEKDITAFCGKLKTISQAEAEVAAAYIAKQITIFIEKSAVEAVHR